MGSAHVHTADAVIVGGGFAGAATAYQLARRGLKHVVLLEQEDLPGRHASGRNAGVARRFISSADHLPLALEGIAFMENPPADFPPGSYFQRTGSMMLAGPGQEERLRVSVAAGRAAGVDGEWLSPREVERLVPAVAGGTFVGGAYGHDDGVADIAALLEAYLRAGREAGVELLAGRCLTAIEADARGIAGVRAGDRRISTRVLINGAGAWAPEVARLAGISSLPLRSLKRHLMVTSAIPWVDRSWPSVWELDHDVYFRPEPPGLLLSPCDAVESGAHSESTDATALELLAEKLPSAFPRLAGVSIMRTFAGLRTFTPDGNLLLGEDPRLRGFHWCAGLGGNGMTLSPAIGRIAAEAVLGTPPPPAHAAARFAPTGH
jgi:glycine/D-amino acid oxidase-like deaminating enzyme